MASMCFLCLVYLALVGMVTCAPSSSRQQMHVYADGKVNRPVVRKRVHHRMNVEDNGPANRPVVRKKERAQVEAKRAEVKPGVSWGQSVLRKVHVPTADPPSPATTFESGGSGPPPQGPHYSEAGDSPPPPYAVNTPINRSASLAAQSLDMWERSMPYTCKVTLYEHWAPGMDSTLARALIGEADASLWGGSFPEGRKFEQVGSGKFPLGSFNWTSSIKVEGRGCFVHGYTTDDCSGSPRSPYPISSATSISSGYPANLDGIDDNNLLPKGVVTPAKNLRQFWFCNDCVRCIRVMQDSTEENLNKTEEQPIGPWNYIKQTGSCKAETGDVFPGSTCDCGWKFPFSCAHLGKSSGADAIDAFKDGRNFSCTLHFSTPSFKCPDGCLRNQRPVTGIKYVGDGNGGPEGPFCHVKSSAQPRPWKGKSLQARSAYALDTARDGCPATTFPYSTIDCCCGQGCCWGWCFVNDPGHNNWAEYYRNATYRHRPKDGNWVSTSSTDEFQQPPAECLIAQAEGARWVETEFVERGVTVKGYKIDYYNVPRPTIPTNPTKFYEPAGGPCTQPHDIWDWNVWKSSTGGYCDCDGLTYKECSELVGGLDAPAAEFDNAEKNCKVFFTADYKCPSFCQASAVESYTATQQNGASKFCFIENNCADGYAEDAMFVETTSVTRNYTATNPTECGAKCNDEAGCRGFMFDGSICKTTGAKQRNTPVANGLKACWKSAPTLWTAPADQAQCKDDTDCASLDCNAAEVHACRDDVTNSGAKKCYGASEDPKCLSEVLEGNRYRDQQPNTQCGVDGDKGFIRALCRNTHVSQHKGFWQGVERPDIYFEIDVNSTEVPSAANLTTELIGGTWAGEIEAFEGTTRGKYGPGFLLKLQPDGSLLASTVVPGPYVRSANRYK